ncbi:hypothetical protein R1sor_000453 [Riccia sorocarpa]|uniref:Uncharacterized protein n=1 Tax=Riccia sorocarpa TaxID=122646 RepID=A0ABD3GUV2_9MARC
MPTLDRFQKIGHGDGLCARCGRDNETVEHLWWTSKESADKWTDFRYLAENLDAYFPQSNSFIDALDAVFKGRNPAKTIPFVFIMRTIWHERNKASYADQRIRIPLISTLDHIRDALQGEADPYRTMENDPTAPRSISDGDNRHSTERLDPLEDQTRNPLKRARLQGEQNTRCEISERTHRSLHPLPTLTQREHMNALDVASRSQTRTTNRWQSTPQLTLQRFPTSSPISTADRSLLRHSHYVRLPDKMQNARQAHLREGITLRKMRALTTHMSTGVGANRSATCDNMTVYHRQSHLTGSGF